MTSADPIVSAILDELRRIRVALEAQRREVLTASEAAARLGIGRDRVADLVARRELSGARDGRRLAIPARDVERLAREGLPPVRPATARGKPRRSAAGVAAEILAIKRRGDR